MENVSILPLSQKFETVRFSKMVNKFVHDLGHHIQGHGIMVNKFVMMSSV
jgi:hypothetical protein